MIQYTAGSNKGKTEQGDVFNSPFGLSKPDVNYTSQTISGEAKTVATAAAVTGKLNWTPVIPGTVNIVHGTVTITDNGEGALTGTGLTGNGTINYTTGEYSYTLTTADTSSVPFANYVYDNVVIPQNDLPLLDANIQAIPLAAKARRIAVYYSQIAAYQAKTDYGFDLGDQLAEKAVGQLAYEIDTEVVQLLADNAPNDGDLVWSKTLPIGVSKQEHYAGFSEILAIAKQKIYDRTQRFAPNYMIIASNILPILSMIPSFTNAGTTDINGPYFAGTIDGLKVFVSPAITAGQFIVGVNGDDMMSSAAVYAPYLSVVPTQLLQFADGGNSEGFSTMYDLKLLNKDLLVAGRITV